MKLPRPHPLLLAVIVSVLMWVQIFYLVRLAIRWSLPE